MRITSRFLLLAASSAAALSIRAESNNCTKPEAIPPYKPDELTNIGMVLFKNFDLIDVFGTLDPLQYLAYSAPLNLYMLAEEVGPINNDPMEGKNKHNSTFWPQALATHSFNDTLDLDVLIVPGGGGARAPNPAVTEYIARVFPKVKILITICTGAGLAASAGVMDGRMATTNKAAWTDTTARGPKVNWVSPARFVIDGKVWSSSGVTSGLDLINEFIKTYWGAERSDGIMGVIEHTPVVAADDPFSAKFNITPTTHTPCEAKGNGTAACKTKRSNPKWYR
jgi:transcriptional regulator GlxA family with amidase domain